MDVQNLSSLISALRAESTYAAITPDSLGALLQKIVDVLAEAAPASEVNTILSWKSALLSSNFVNVALGPGYSDESNVYLSENRLTLANGSVYNAPNSVRIPLASDTKAGAMGAEHVRAIEALKGIEASIAESIESLSSTISALVSDVKINKHIYYRYTNGEWVGSDVLSTNSIFLHVFFKNNTVSSTSVNLPSSSSSSRSLWFLTCDTKDNVLYVPGAKALTTAGFLPFIFRYTLKRNRLNNPDDYERPLRGPKRRGWHVFYDKYLARVDNNNAISFNKLDEEGYFTNVYSNSPSKLVKVRPVYDDNVLLCKLKVGFGKKTIDAIKGRRFKFGIGFAPEQEDIGPFDFSSLVTNIAPFYVHVHPDENMEDVTIDYSI